MYDPASGTAGRPNAAPETQAFSVRVQGIVQGVGFRPFVHRLARRHNVNGWVRNAEQGVELHLEGAPLRLRSFLDDLQAHPPPAARIARLTTAPAAVEGSTDFTIRASMRLGRPSTRIAPDLPVCTDCLGELFDPADPRYAYPYITCTACGPRYSILLGLPYDRSRTTMAPWPMCPDCARAYADLADRRYHAEPVACPACGPRYVLQAPNQAPLPGAAAITEAARRLRDGQILAVKGLGGYHLACDARNAESVAALRRRKVRKEKPFALMARDLETARALVVLGPAHEALLTAPPHPIVLTPAREPLPGVAPDNRDVGVMLPYTPLHHLLFHAGAPALLVMTSGNRSSEPIAYHDDDAGERLDGIADAFLVGERAIARRVDDSVARAGPFGPVLLRRARGFAPDAVACLPTTRPILAVGADLKNTVTLVVEGQAFVSQHLGDLGHYAVEQSFLQSIEDLTTMYDVALEDALVVHDAHPQYRTTLLAAALPGAHRAVQHHRAHIASALAERAAWDRPVVGIAFDGTGYGDDGSIWGGEVFVGSLRSGLLRVDHLQPAVLPGGDAAARFPVQAAAGFLDALGPLPDLTAPPFHFPDRYEEARALLRTHVRTFATTSVGRLFDAVAALLGFTRRISFEGQAAIWLEHLARSSPAVAPYPFPDLDFRPLLRAVVDDRCAGRPVDECARAFHGALARAVVETGRRHCRAHGVDTLVLSGGVFQNQLLLEGIRDGLQAAGPRAPVVWMNAAVPPNDGGVSLGQAALAACALTP